MEADLRTIRETVEGAALTDDVRRTALWCLDRLPGLYHNLCETYDNRYGDEIGRLIQGLLKALDGKKKKPAAGEVRVADVVRDRFAAMHERLGIPGPGAGKRKAG